MNERLLKKVRSVLVGIILAVCLSSFARDSFAESSVQMFREQYEPLVEQALNAYNKEDYTEFYANFSIQRKARTPRIFHFIWVDGYKGKYGNFMSKAILPAESNMVGFSPLLVYRAVFEKDPNVRIKVNFIQDTGTYRIFSMRFDAIGDKTGAR